MAGSNGKWVNPKLSEYRGDNVSGATVRQTLDSLTSYLGGWVDDSGRYPMVNNEQAGFGGSRGNATVVSWFKITGDECHWYGHYAIGSTTGWAAVGVNLIPPVRWENTTFVFLNATSMPGTAVRAYNGTFHYGFVEYTSDQANCMDAAVANTPWSAATNQPFTWGNGNILSWDLRYRIKV